MSRILGDPAQMKQAGLRALLIRIWRRWTAIAVIIGTFQARVLLSVFYLVIIPPFALIVKLWLDPLHLRRAAGSSAWITRPPRPEADVLRAGRQY